jgi:hypothetical protein
VLLFGPVSPGLWGPPPDRVRHRALWHGEVAGDAPEDVAGGSAPHPALLRITEAEVVAAAALALRSAGVRRAAAAK